MESAASIELYDIVVTHYLMLSYPAEPDDCLKEERLQEISLTRQECRLHVPLQSEGDIHIPRRHAQTSMLNYCVYQ